jgi:hypothetical protein
MGLLADIHEDVDRLAAAIEWCQREGANRLFTLGDIFATGERFADAVDLLREANVGGVWGNHEFGLFAGRGSVESMFDWRTLDYMHRLDSRIEVEGVLLSHVLPCIDPTDIQQSWYVKRAPVTSADAAPNFEAFPHRRMFVGHFHRWLTVTPNGALDWSGTKPIVFDSQERYLVVIAAVCDGWCAIYDTDSDVLTPCDLGPRRPGRQIVRTRARSTTTVD